MEIDDCGEPVGCKFAHDGELPRHQIQSKGQCFVVIDSGMEGFQNLMSEVMDLTSSVGGSEVSSIGRRMETSLLREEE